MSGTNDGSLLFYGNPNKIKLSNKISKTTELNKQINNIYLHIDTNDLPDSTKNLTKTQLNKYLNPYKDTNKN